MNLNKRSSLKPNKLLCVSVFNANLQTEMGKTIVRGHLTTTDAQSVRRELSEHMRTSSKGASETRRLTQYVTNPVLDDNFKKLQNSLCSNLISNLGNWVRYLMTVRNFHPQ